MAKDPVITDEELRQRIAEARVLREEQERTGTAPIAKPRGRARPRLRSQRASEEGEDPSDWKFRHRIHPAAGRGRR